MSFQTYAMERKPKCAGTTEHYAYRSLQLSPKLDCSGSIKSVKDNNFDRGRTIVTLDGIYSLGELPLRESNHNAKQNSERQSKPLARSPECVEETELSVN